MWHSFLGKTSNDFKYLKTNAPAEDMDFTGLAEVQDAIRELGISINEEKDIFKALGGLLHLGQVHNACTASFLSQPPTPLADIDPLGSSTFDV